MTINTFIDAFHAALAPYDDTVGERAKDALTYTKAYLKVREARAAQESGNDLFPHEVQGIQKQVAAAQLINPCGDPARVAALEFLRTELAVVQANHRATSLENLREGAKRRRLPPQEQAARDAAKLRAKEKKASERAEEKTAKQSGAALAHSYWVHAQYYGVSAVHKNAAWFRKVIDLAAQQEASGKALDAIRRELAAYVTKMEAFIQAGGVPPV